MIIGKPINLELIGNGSHCTQEILQYCDDNLEKYYNLDVGYLNGKNELISKELIDINEPSSGMI